MPPRRRSVLLAQLTIDAPGGSQGAILDEMRRVVLSGDAPPGTPIPLGEVAELFGVSRIPVREALKTLIGEGLVDHRPNAGYAVAQLTSVELRELYIVREVLETAALSAAAELSTDDDHAAAIAIDAELRGAIDDSSRYHRLSREFHMTLARPRTCTDSCTCWVRPGTSPNRCNRWCTSHPGIARHFMPTTRKCSTRSSRATARHWSTLRNATTIA